MRFVAAVLHLHTGSGAWGVWVGLSLVHALTWAQADVAGPTPEVAVVDLGARKSLTRSGLFDESGFSRVDFSLIAQSSAAADPSRRLVASGRPALAVVYPDIDEPFRSVFAQIVQGIESGTRFPVRSYPVGPNVDPDDLNAAFRGTGVRAVIALGRQGLRAAAAIDRDIPVVVGGVLAIPDTLVTSDGDSRTVVGVSLTPDPALLFARLKNLVPTVRRVTVVYNPQRNEWLIKMARDAAKLHGLDLVALEASDLASAARMYEAAFASSEGRRDAVWLPQDATTVDENAILPLVLKESWNRSVPVFSSSFLHVKKGALFALYPNNVELGRTLAGSAEAAATGDPRRRSVLPLRDVQIAVNLRTASHLGLNLGYPQQRNFDITFPEP
jgi:putative ABC transport system substrate-binding protein